MTNGVAPGAPVAGPAAATKSLRLRWWFIAVPLLVITLIGQVDKVAISVVMSNKQFLQDLKLIGRPAVTGLLMSGFLLSYAVFHFFWGYFVKRFGPRISAIAGIIVWAGTMALSGIAQTAGAMITARVILGVGEAFTFPVSNTFVANWFPVKERGRANSIWMNGMMLGPVVVWGLGRGCDGRRGLADGLLRPCRALPPDTPATGNLSHEGSPASAASGSAMPK